jgi:hypothetical protein
MSDIVERLEAHMGKAEIKDVLPDCREAAAEIRRLRAEVVRLKANESNILSVTNCDFNSRRNLG